MMLLLLNSLRLRRLLFDLTALTMTEVASKSPTIPVQSDSQQGVETLDEFLCVFSDNHVVMHDSPCALEGNCVI